MKSLKVKVTVESEITEFQTSSLEVPDEFLSWPADRQKGFIDAKVSESLRAHDGQEHAPRQGVRIVGVLLDDRKILGEFPIQPDVGAAGRSLLRAMEYARAGRSHSALFALEDACKSLKVSKDAAGVLVRALQNVAGLHKPSADLDTDVSPRV